MSVMMPEDGIYFDVFVVHEGIRFGIKQLSVRELYQIISDAVLDAVDKVVVPAERYKENIEETNNANR